jgi:hypothetical protein
MNSPSILAQMAGYELETETPDVFHCDNPLLHATPSWTLFVRLEDYQVLTRIQLTISGRHLVKPVHSCHQVVPIFINAPLCR